MSYVFFQDVLNELGHRLNYEAVVNYAGNSFCEKSWQMIEDSNPFNVTEGKNGKTNKKTANALASFLTQADVVIKKGKGESHGEKDV